MTTLTAKANTTIAYTDGACKGNPGLGGWGAYLVYTDGSTQELYAGEANTTNNRMEMTATIEAIKQAVQHSPNNKIELWTDSVYVRDGISKWMDGWKKKGWKTASKKPVKNQDLWQQIDALNQAHSVEWHWIKGHAGHEGNEKADELANQGVVDPKGNVSAIKKSLESSQAIADVPANITTDTATNTATSKTVDNADDWLDSDILGFDAEDFDSEDLEEDLLEEEEVLENSELANTEVPQSQLSPSQPPPQGEELPSLREGLGEGNRINGLQNKVEIDVENVAVAKAEETKEVEEIGELPVFDGDTSRANPNFRPLLPTPKNKGRNNRQLIMDTETTGFEYNNGDRIIEVGIVEMIGRKFTGEKLHVYINPNRKEPMSEEVIRVHGITDAFLADKPTFDKVAKQVYDFMEGAEIIAHNANFDMNFLDMEFTKAGLPRLSEHAKITDSLAIAKSQYPGQRNTLDALVRRLNVGKQDRTFHGALLDSEILAEVYLAMTGGQVSLAIDDNSGDDGEVHHQTFSELASMLVADNADVSLHDKWFDDIHEKFPAVEEVWGEPVIDSPAEETVIQETVTQKTSTNEETADTESTDLDLAMVNAETPSPSEQQNSLF